MSRPAFRRWLHLRLAGAHDTQPAASERNTDARDSEPGLLFRHGQNKRGSALGRRNWLFGGSDEGAKRLAILYTLLGSCQIVGIADPWAYLRDVLDKLSHNWPHSRLDELLPQPWKSARSTP